MEEKYKQKEELIISLNLKTYLSDVVDNRFGYRLGEPWKYSEETLGVVVPILRENSPDRQYITMYEVLKELNIKDTGKIAQVELQNKSGIAIFVRVGTIFTGKTQNRASQHSGVYPNEKEIIDVRCVNASHGIRQGEEMGFGDFAPPSVTMNLMSKDQSDVWNSVSNYGASINNTSSDRTTSIPEELPKDVKRAFDHFRSIRLRRSDAHLDIHTFTNDSGVRKTRISRIYPCEDVTQLWSGELSSGNIESISKFIKDNNIKSNINSNFNFDNSNDLLGKIRNNQSVLDDMMQKVPLFDNQVGAILFDPVGVIALEMFDHPKSWESIKKEIIEKYGDKIKEKQAEHLFELKSETIIPAFKKFIDKIDKSVQKIIKKDNLSETRSIIGDGIIGEYTLVKGQPIHVLLLKDNEKFESK